MAECKRGFQVSTLAYCKYVQPVVWDASFDEVELMSR